MTSPRRLGHTGLLRPPVGSGLRPALLGKGSVSHRFPLLRNAPAPRRGGPVCPPAPPLRATRSRADTQVGPYKTSINPQKPLQKAKATNAQCRFEIYQAIPNLVSRKVKCLE